MNIEVSPVVSPKGIAIIHVSARGIQQRFHIARGAAASSITGNIQPSTVSFPSTESDRLSEPMHEIHKIRRAGAFSPALKRPGDEAIRE